MMVSSKKADGESFPLLRWLYPRRCPVCDKVINGEGNVCPDCPGKLAYIKEPRCKRCSRPLICDAEELCPDCVHKKVPFKEGWAVFTYTDPVKSSVLALKFKNRPEYAAFYADEMYESSYSTWERWGIEALVPVPVHPSRKRARGYNQAELLADHLGRKSGLPVEKELLLRVKKTRPQKSLGDRERRDNLAGAFAWNHRIRTEYRRVLLIDDIYTTGSTIAGCSIALQQAGVKEVYFLCICIGRG